jgi:hypothetical protein
MAAALLGDFSQFAPAERNIVFQLFCGPRSIDSYDDPEVELVAEQSVADLRAAAARYPDDPGIKNLLSRLRANSPDFERRWSAHRVCVPRGMTKRLHHPVVGELELECEILDIADRGQRMVIYTAAPGSRSAGSLRLLAVVGTQWS